MSKDTIYRGDAIDEMERIMADHPLQGYEDELLLINAIKSLPSADRPQGKWLFDRYDTRGINRCSECGAEIKGYGKNIPFPNCPYCLARMERSEQ